MLGGWWWPGSNPILTHISPVPNPQRLRYRIRLQEIKLVQLMSSQSTIQLVNTTGALRSERILTHAASLRNKTGVHGLATYQWWKSVFDRMLALLAIVISSPILALIAIGIRIDSPGNPVFRREQVGENGRTFSAYKFRTMYINNDEHIYKAYLVKYILENAPYTVDKNGQGVYKVVNDPRVTRFGALLRKTNLDELPQFFNVLKGEMSLVGPRPDVPFAVAMYKDWHHKRLGAKPGITGLWQVCRRKSLPFEGMVRLDINYIKRQSLLLDAKIILLTIATIIRRDGSS
jgi:lipopolysaccharide/colanic/teichoic acid biosynthesis glycosyltransferase